MPPVADIGNIVDETAVPTTNDTLAVNMVTVNGSGALTVKFIVVLVD